MLSAEASSAICVQRFDGSRNSAIHTTYRISLRSSSLREPRYPLLRVVIGLWAGAGERLACFSVWFGVGWKKCQPRTAQPPPVRRGAMPQTLPVQPLAPARSATGRRAARIGARGLRGGRQRAGQGVHGVVYDRFNDPSAGSPTETLLRLLLPLGGRV